MDLTRDIDKVHTGNGRMSVCTRLSKSLVEYRRVKRWRENW